MQNSHPNRVQAPHADASPGGRAAENGKCYLIGGGIASLAAAAFLIRDGRIRGCDITILEALNKPGGSLDGSGTAESGYVLRGGRMLESRYLCTYDLFSSIPTLDDSKSVTQEIFDWNETVRPPSTARLVRNGRRETAPADGLAETHLLTLGRLSIEPEAMLDASRIVDHFEASFFKTNFWLTWCATFAFQPWHSAAEFRRYLLRFAHMSESFDQLHGNMLTVYNQYDSMIHPLRRWLDNHGVVFDADTRVTDLLFDKTGALNRVRALVCDTAQRRFDLPVGPSDKVIVTPGSITAASSMGGMDYPAPLDTLDSTGAWSLWKNIAADHPEFGHPSVFADHREASRWLSFTATLRDPTLFQLIRDMTGNMPGEGGLITFAESNWLASIVLPHQPHFSGQSADVQVLWGYGLRVDEPGNFVDKPMHACTGREILTEILLHLNIEADAEQIMAQTNCIPCMMPYITSQFLPRQRGDRPAVVPEGWRDLAFIGPFCELPDDVVFTVEYSVRSAQNAVYKLLGLDRTPPALHKGRHDPRVYKAFSTSADRR
ncbi:oleate hydratase [Paraburkholderia sp. BCC1885]|uniref:oleate hydratase n=1 Tax=Paraburkholderia sp. BCC1885 TaxID=2562669 RepID=UPI0011833E72|nr:oleate hydratase [Paraburkholderia sp. BCC1885]